MAAPPAGAAGVPGERRSRVVLARVSWSDGLGDLVDGRRWEVDLSRAGLSGAGGSGAIRCVVGVAGPLRGGAGAERYFERNIMMVQFWKIIYETTKNTHRILEAII